MSYIEFKNVCKQYIMGEITINALNNTNFEIEKGELVVIVGPSGAGKTTALNILGGMDIATSGKVIVDGKEVSKLKNRQLVKYRREGKVVYYSLDDEHIETLFLTSYAHISERG